MSGPDYTADPKQIEAQAAELFRLEKVSIQINYYGPGAIIHILVYKEDDKKRPMRIPFDNEQQLKQWLERAKHKYEMTISINNLSTGKLVL